MFLNIVPQRESIPSNHIWYELKLMIAISRVFQAQLLATIIVSSLVATSYG